MRVVLGEDAPKLLKFIPILRGELVGSGNDLKSLLGRLRIAKEQIVFAKESLQWCNVSYLV